MHACWDGSPEGTEEAENYLETQENKQERAVMAAGIIQVRQVEAWPDYTEGNRHLLH